MIVLSCSNLTKSYIADNVLEDITFAVNDGEKIGVVGLNGAGKTTLFKIISDELSLDSGSIYVSKSCKLGYLKQNTKIVSEKTVYEEALEVFNDILNMEKRLRELEILISESANENDENLEKHMNEYSRLSEKFSSLNGYAYDSEIKGTLKGLGFSDEEINKPINLLSGGQKTRVILAKLLLQKPDILLLDEPTNHLDIEAISWLEKFLKEYKGAALVISHDRYFLDAIVTKVYHLENTKLEIYNGNYSSYMKKRKEELELLRKKYEQQQGFIVKQEEIIRRFMDYRGQRYIRQAKSRQKMLDKMKKIDKPLGDNKKANFRFEPSIKSGNEVLNARNLEKSFNDNLLFKDINFDIYKGDRVGLIGPNGIGKSTLFKIVLNDMDYNAGDINLGHHVNIGYFDQEQSNLNDENTIVDEIWDEHPNFDHYQIRSMLARFLFTGDDIFKIIGTLSGGEKSRLALLKLMLSKSNFLLMDEPTNHLDIDSKEVLEDALLNYTGTLLVISHDRYFLNKVTNKILDLNEDGLKEYLGNYNYYLEKKNGLNLVEEEEISGPTKTQLKLERKKNKEKEKESRALKNKIKTLEKDIANIENRIEEIESLMCTPEVYNNHELSQELNIELSDSKNDLDTLFEEWIYLTEEKAD